VKGEDAYVAVEKNAAGSRPKELFEDVLEEVEARFEKDRTVLKVRPDSRPNRGLVTCGGLLSKCLPILRRWHRQAVGEAACLSVLSLPMGLHAAGAGNGHADLLNKAC